MNKDLEQLIQLSKYDVEITQFEPKIANENAKLDMFLKTVDTLKEQIEQIYKDIDENKNKRIKNDIHLKELAAKFEDIQEKTKVVKTEKEIKALQLEEEIAKEQVNFANEEIQRVDELISSQEAELESLKAQLAQEEEEVQEVKEAVQKVIEELEVSRANISKQRTELFEKVDKKVLAFYEKIRRWAKETAVVPVKKQACYGCHMKLTDRVYYDFINSDDIKTCPHCGRIIYKEEE